MRLWNLATSLSLFLLASPQAQALVTGSSASTATSLRLSLGRVEERGTVEPHRDRRSYQNAQTDLNSLAYTYQLGPQSFLLSSSIQVQFANFSSAKEEVQGTLFHEADQGQIGGFEFQGVLMHELERQFSFFIRWNPLLKMNSQKFANPKIDQWGLGLESALAITDSVFQKNLLYFGSGFREQSSSVALSSNFGYRHQGEISWVLGAGLFLEADLKDRFDEKYDAVYSTAGDRDRVRSLKYGVTTQFELGLADHWSLQVIFLERLGGYDARATRVMNLGLSKGF